MTAVEESAPPSDQQEIGIIYPPPEIRVIVDKTAAFISSRGGLELEAKVRERERQNPKFSFLNPGDPYYPYYQIQLSKARDAKVAAIKAEEAKARGETVTETPASKLAAASTAEQLDEQLAKSTVPAAAPEPTKAPPKQPPPFEFCQSTPVVNPQDLDIVKLTAMFVARNGRQFMNQLAQREAKNYQFDFLRQGHSLFNYFTKLVESYTKILLPSNELMSRLQMNAEDRYSILERCVERSEWERFQEESRKQKEKQAEEEKDEQQDLPAPTTVEAVQNMTIIQRKSLFAADTQQTSIGAAATTATSLPQVGGPPQPGTAAVVDEEDDMDMDME